MWSRLGVEEKKHLFREEGPFNGIALWQFVEEVCASGSVLAEL